MASPAPSESGPVRIDEGYTGVEAQACADLREGRLTAAEPSGDLPDGATRAWLCGPQDPYPFAGQLGPREPLTSGVDRIVAAFNAMPEVDPDGSVACHDVGGLTYAVILEYADGPVVLDGETVNCEFVAGRIGGGARFLTHLEGSGRRPAPRRRHRSVRSTSAPTAASTRP
ncbi:hypothetical protein G7085_01810 [Tessaracoccus sp. HDW20]|nr:hypothetical protein [Tessaracoccus coleopterorum]